MIHQPPVLKIHKNMKPKTSLKQSTTQSHALRNRLMLGGRVKKKKKNGIKLFLKQSAKGESDFFKVSLEVTVVFGNGQLAAFFFLLATDCL